MLLESIQTVEDLRKLRAEELPALAEELRDYIIETISHTGGHLAPSLGVVELTIALHYVFSTPRDKIIWDVGHQCYAHKILTGRREAFKTIRRFGGISGFPKMKESPHDTFNVGHSSTSLSLALGAAAARDLGGDNYKVVAVIGDGSMTGGMSFEALNNMGHMENDVIVILNDNEHSISHNVGALSQYLTRIITGSFYNRFRRRTMNIIKRIPRIGKPLFNFIYRFFESFKGMIIPGQLFEDLGIRYFGPIDGHNIPVLIDFLHRVKDIDYGPKIVHVITKKGRGYLPAEMNPAQYHGIGPFDRLTGIPNGGSKMSYSEVAGKTLAHLADRDRRIIAVTAAMKLGTGLYEFELKAPERFFDVGIAEQHAVTFAGAMAAGGLRPFVSIYSTFLQRAVDQLIHDVAIMNLPVRILIDRSGIVGEDGETHHGLFDIPLLRTIPNFTILAASDGAELRDMINYAVSHDSGPIAIRYPRGAIRGERNGFSVNDFGSFVPGKMKRVAPGRDVALIACGDMVSVALEVREILRASGIDAGVVNLRSIKPLDTAGLNRVIAGTRGFVTLENGVIIGGAGEAVLASIHGYLRDRLIFHAGFPDVFVTHGSMKELFSLYGLDAAGIAARIHAAMKPSRSKRGTAKKTGRGAR